jgi:hypothetical protein
MSNHEIPKEPMLETDPEVSAKRTAEMQALAQPYNPPPFKGNLTIIWESEKQQLLGRQEYLEKRIYDCEERLRVLEAWALQLKREPTFFTKV